MNPKKVFPTLRVTAVLLLATLACNFGRSVTPTANPALVAPPVNAPPLVPPAPPAVTHVSFPSDSVGSGKLIYDVVSEDTAPENRAPYGDSYGKNLLERPFQQKMSYVRDLDIESFTVSSDESWWFVSTALIGNNPNNKLGINYGVELDLDHDGFGDYLVWGHPPYTSTWETAPVQLFQDTNHDTAGRSPATSDAPITTDGYETLIFSGAAGGGDPDMAWMRVILGDAATVQFAFKKSWSGTVFMLGVISDAGLKDPKKLDYVDRFSIYEAGSPVRDNANYACKALDRVDNACRAAIGFRPTGDEPQLCPDAGQADPGQHKRRKPLMHYEENNSCPPINCGPYASPQPYPICGCIG